MFGKLKDKLKGALKVFSKEVEQEAQVTEELVTEQEEPVVLEEQEQPEGAIEAAVKEVNIDDEHEEPELVEERPVTSIERDEHERVVTDAPNTNDKRTDSVRQVEEAPIEKKKGFFSRITRVKLSDEKFERLFWELEVVLLENNVAVEVIEKIKHDLQTVLSGSDVQRKSVEELVSSSLKNTLSHILSVKPIDLIKEAHKKKSLGEPLIITVIGVNGSGKTTTLAKLIRLFQQQELSVVVAAADTFRAAAIQQLEEHTNKLGVKLIKHDYRADPSAVAFDAVKHARAQHIDVVLIDTAGRLHSNDNLIAELKKLVRVNTPDIKLFVGEAITGNDCVEQARQFDQAVGIDAIILAKADVDEKGGAAISASFVTGKPVIYLGVGQTYDDLVRFEPEIVIKSLGL